MDGKLLCVRLKPRPDAKHDFWCLPGGSVDEGEPLVDAFRREMIEELGVEPKIGRLLYVYQFTHGDTEFTEFHFHIENPEDYQNVDFTQTSHGAQELEKLEFVDPSKVYVLPKFLATEKPGKIYHKQAAKFFFEP